MNNYFRITAYHPERNICAIFDSNGKFEKIWQFSALLVNIGFKIIKVNHEGNFLEGDMPKGENVPSSQIRIRACAKGEPLINGNIVTVNGKSYEVME